LIALRFLLFPYHLVDGEGITEFEQAFARVVGTRYAISFSAGRIGLYGLLKALGVGPGDEVLMQAPTHIVVPNAVRYLGARPVYVDCCRSDYNINIRLVEKLITGSTRALVLQHTFGIPADISSAQDLAKRFNLALIEDCVHALGAKYKGRPVGSFGDAAFFSTEETKIISTTMGGMVVTDDADLAAKMLSFKESCPAPPFWQSYLYVFKLLIYHILTQPHVHRYARALYDFLGRWHPLPKPTNKEELAGRKPAHYEQRLSRAQALLGLRQLDRLKDNLAHRRKIADLYRQLLENKGFYLPGVSVEVDSSWVRYPIWVDSRSHAEKLLAPHTVVGTWFTSVLEEALSPEAGDYTMGTCPIAEDASKHLINLPTHLRVKEEDVERIVSALSRWHK
jgi:dTDP-4-amino-4,6-dideoxygalactose transaminase